MTEIPNLVEPTSPEKTVQDKPKLKFVNYLLPIFLILLVIGLGIFSGYYFGSKSQQKEETQLSTEVSSEKIVKGSEFGSSDLSKFKDTAVGVLEKNGLDGEGTHKLIRDGGPSQTVYLTSSVLDLDQFVGRKIQVWGETFQAQKAGWFMDVGRIKVIE